MQHMNINTAQSPQQTLSDLSTQQSHVESEAKAIGGSVCRELLLHGVGNTISTRSYPTE